MPKLTEQHSTTLDSSHTAGISPGDANNFYITYVNSDHNIKVEQCTLSPTGQYQRTSLHAPGKATMSPALTPYNGLLYLFYREYSSDTSHDKDFYYSFYANGVWSDAIRPNNNVKASSDHNPVILNVANEIWLVDKNNEHHFIAECWMHSSGNWHTSNNKTYWISDGDNKQDWGYQNKSNDEKDGGEEKEANQIETSSKGNPITPRNPSLALFNNQVYMAFKGGRTAGDSSDEKLYMCTANIDHSWTNNPTHFLSGETSKYAPSITSCNGYLICVFNRKGHSDHLYYSLSSDGSNWSNPVKLNDDEPSNNKATDPFIMTIDNNKVALSYVTGGVTQLKIYDFS